MKLTPAQLERWALLSEELNEAAALIGKLLRHGPHSYNPDDPTECPNHQLVARELGDVEYAIKLLTDSGVLFWSEIQLGKRIAERNKPKYLHHQDDE
jgi:hypothetical protein